MIIAGTACFLFITFFTGFRLSRFGKPYGTWLFNLHKLFALAAAAATGWFVVRTSQASSLDAKESAAVVITAVFFLGAMISGGIASARRTIPAGVSAAHKIFPVLTVLSASAALYFLLTRGM